MIYLANVVCINQTKSLPFKQGPVSCAVLVINVVVVVLCPLAPVLYLLLLGMDPNDMHREELWLSVNSLTAALISYVAVVFGTESTLLLAV